MPFFRGRDLEAIIASPLANVLISPLYFGAGEAEKKVYLTHRICFAREASSDMRACSVPILQSSMTHPSRLEMVCSLISVYSVPWPICNNRDLDVRT